MCFEYLRVHFEYFGTRYTRDTSQLSRIISNEKNIDFNCTIKQLVTLMIYFGILNCIVGEEGIITDGRMPNARILIAVLNTLT